MATNKPFEGLSMEPETAAVMSRLESMDEGETITHEELERLTHSRRPTPRYQQIIQKVKRRMKKENKVILISQRSVGYVKATGAQQMENGLKGFAQVARQAGRSYDTVIIISDDRLPDPRMRRARDFIAQRGKYVAELIRVERKAMAVELTVPETRPQLVVG